jgi:hypothetical protein
VGAGGGRRSASGGVDQGKAIAPKRGKQDQDAISSNGFGQDLKQDLKPSIPQAFRDVEECVRQRRCGEGRKSGAEDGETQRGTGCACQGKEAAAAERRSHDTLSRAARFARA